MKANRLLIASILALLLTLTTAPLAPAAAQDVGRALDHDDYDRWERIDDEVLSDDGLWLVWSQVPGEGDATLHVRDLQGSRSATVARGTEPRISADSRFLVFTIEPLHAVVDSLEGEGKRGDDLPDDSLGIVDLARFRAGTDLDVVRIAHVQAARLPEEGAGWVAYLLETPEEEGEEDEEAETEEEPEPGAEPEEEGEEGPDREKEKGDPLVLRSLETGEEVRFEDVTAWAFSQDGRWLTYAASNEDGTADGVHAVETATGAATPLLTGEGEYTGLALDEAGRHVAFLSNRDDWAADAPAFTLYVAELGAGGARAAASPVSAGIPDGWAPSEHGRVWFSESGERLFFGMAPRPEPEPEEVPDDEEVRVDVWSWQDGYLQPMQLEQAEEERQRTYLTWVPTSGGDAVQLEDETVLDVTVGEDGDGDRAVGTTDLPYRQLLSWDGRYYDVYLVDVGTGERERIVERLRGGFYGWTLGLSPESRYVYWWDPLDRTWRAMEVESRERVDLASGIPFPVHDELDDRPEPPSAHGLAGWTEGDDAVLVYDRYDIWMVDPERPESARSVTEGVGRRDSLRFRYVGLDDELEHVPTDEEVLVSAFNTHTKADGFYRDRFDARGEPRRLVMDDVDYGSVERAADADVVLFTRETFRDFPDLWVADTEFRSPEKISAANPWQSEYRWGSAELVEWTSADGIPLRGILYTPDGFDPSRQYPMMVYFYERMSDGLHNHIVPSAGSSSINRTFYVSRGYLVFVPDIPYEVPHPGESALDAVVPGVLSLMDEGFVDPDRIGVQGHSWGGYQIAYMITRSDLFAAAEAGAPVANMTSAYGGIRWGTGMSRMFQYERTQSRVGGTLWDSFQHYVDNSPLFHADKIKTPLLMMHNDEDTAVPWEQGIEMFVALRRLGKPVWMLNYNGEPHGLRRDANREDWAIRMQQFFDHYLKDAPPPVWLVEGVPATEKGRTLGRELVTEEGAVTESGGGSGGGGG